MADGFDVPKHTEDRSPVYDYIAESGLAEIIAEAKMMDDETCQESFSIRTLLNHQRKEDDGNVDRQRQTLRPDTRGNDGKWHKASVNLTKTTPQARRSAEKALKDKIEGILSAKEEKRLNELISEYLAHKDIKPSSLRNYRSGFKKIIELFWMMSRSRLSTPFIKQKSSRAVRTQVTTNRLYSSCLIRFFKWAYEYGYIKHPIKISAEKVQKKKPREASELYLEADELEKSCLIRCKAHITAIYADLWL